MPVPGQLDLEPGGLSTKTNEERRDSLPYQLKLAFTENWGVLLGGDAYVWLRDPDNRISGFGDTDALITMGEKIDILFDLTGVPAVRRDLREKLMAADNRHTIIATETIAKLIWSLVASDVALPSVHGKTGY